MAQVEFYNGQTGPLIAALQADAVPRSGELINIQKVTWQVQRVTWALDYANSRAQRLRANIELVEPTEEA